MILDDEKNNIDCEYRFHKSIFQLQIRQEIALFSQSVFSVLP